MKETLYAIWLALEYFSKNSSDHKKLALKDNLRNIKMQRNKTIPQYLTRFTKCHDELVQVGVTIIEDDLVSLALIGLPKSTHNYQDSVNGRDKLPNWEFLWFDLV